MKCNYHLTYNEDYTWFILIELSSVNITGKFQSNGFVWWPQRWRKGVIPGLEAVLIGQ